MYAIFFGPPVVHNDLLCVWSKIRPWVWTQMAFLVGGWIGQTWQVQGLIFFSLFYVGLKAGWQVKQVLLNGLDHPHHAKCLSHFTQVLRVVLKYPECFAQNTAKKGLWKTDDHLTTRLTMENKKAPRLPVHVGSVPKLVIITTNPWPDREVTFEDASINCTEDRHVERVNRWEAY